MGTKLAMLSACHPQFDSQTEALNKCLEQYLQCFSFDYPKKWLELLPWVEFWYNTTTHTSTSLTPFKAVYGRDPPTLHPYYSSDRDLLAVSTMLQ